MHFFSVIIPLYNKQPHIKRAIDSVLDQTYPNFELIVINDGSTDGGPDIVSEISDDRLKIINQNNHGVSYTRNLGVKLSKYDWVAFLDADDSWHDCFLENAQKLIKEHPSIKMLGTSYYNAFGNNIFKIQDFKYVPQSSGVIENYFKAQLYKGPVCASTAVINKVAFIDTGGFPEEIRRGEDNFLWNLIAINYPVGFINIPLATRYFDAVNRVTQDNNITDDFILLEYLSEKKICINERDLIYLKEFIVKKRIGIIIRCIKIGDIEKAKYLLRKINYTMMFKKKYLLLKIFVRIPKYAIKIIINLR